MQKGEIKTWKGFEFRKGYTEYKVELLSNFFSGPDGDISYWVVLMPNGKKWVVPENILF